MPMNSAIASSVDRFDSAETVVSDWLRQRRSVSGVTPRPFATAAIAFVSDEYEERDSTSRLTAFALNLPVYLVPLPWFHHLPSRQGKYGTKISSYQWQSWSNCD